jgi:hypothetical protein
VAETPVWKRTCTCVAITMHTLQRMHRDCSERARSLLPPAFVLPPASELTSALIGDGLGGGGSRLVGRERGLAQFLIVLSRGSRRLASFPLRGFGLTQLATQRLDLFGEIICALRSGLGLGLR